MKEELSLEGAASSPELSRKAGILAKAAFGITAITSPVHAQALFDLPGQYPGTPGIQDIDVPGAFELTYAQGVDHQGTWTAESIRFEFTQDPEIPGDPNSGMIHLTQVTNPIREPRRNNGMLKISNGKGGVTTIEVDAEIRPDGPRSRFLVDGFSQWDDSFCRERGPASLFASRPGLVGINQGYDDQNSYFVPISMDCLQFADEISNGVFNAAPPVTNNVLSLLGNGNYDGAFLDSERLVSFQRFGGVDSGNHFALGMPNGQAPLYLGLSDGVYTTTPANGVPEGPDDFWPNGAHINYVWAFGEGVSRENPDRKIQFGYSKTGDRLQFTALQREGDPENPAPSDTMRMLPMDPVVRRAIQPTVPDYDEDGRENDSSPALNTGSMPESLATCFPDGTRNRHGEIICDHTDNGYDNALQGRDGNVFSYKGDLVINHERDGVGRKIYHIEVANGEHHDEEVVAEVANQHMLKARRAEQPTPIISLGRAPRRFAYNLDVTIGASSTLHGEPGRVRVESLNDEGNPIAEETTINQSYELSGDPFTIDSTVTHAEYRVTLREVEAEVIEDMAIPDVPVPDLPIEDILPKDAVVQDAVPVDAGQADIVVSDVPVADVQQPDAVTPLPDIRLPEEDVPVLPSVDAAPPADRSPLQDARAAVADRPTPDAAPEIADASRAADVPMARDLPLAADLPQAVDIPHISDLPPLPVIADVRPPVPDIQAAPHDAGAVADIRPLPDLRIASDTGPRPHDAAPLADRQEPADAPLQPLDSPLQPDTPVDDAFTDDAVGSDARSPSDIKVNPPSSDPELREDGNLATDSLDGGQNRESVDSQSPNCGCDVPGQSKTNAPWYALGALAALALTKRRRTK